MSFILLVSVLIIFSTIQSVLGVGLLVFGTPTLLIMDHSFEETLSIVLPASICISLLQVLEPQVSGKSFRKEFNLICLPFVFIGVYFVLYIGKNIDLSIFVGVMLFVSGAIRLSPKLNKVLSLYISQNRKIYQVSLGLIHGLTNMGGGLLTLFSSSIHNGDKDSTRAGVAYGYLLMGIIQYGLLLFFRPDFISIKVFFYILIAGTSYLIFGKRLYVNTREKIFHNSVTAIILFYGCILVFR